MPGITSLSLSLPSKSCGTISLGTSNFNPRMYARPGILGDMLHDCEAARAGRRGLTSLLQAHREGAKIRTRSRHPILYIAYCCAVIRYEQLHTRLAHDLRKWIVGQLTAVDCARDRKSRKPTICCFTGLRPCTIVRLDPKISSPHNECHEDYAEATRLGM